MKKILITAAIACLPLFAIAANKTNVHGTADTATTNTRVILVQPSTKYVNVIQGDTVNFVVGGKSFAWHFDTLRDSDSFLMSDIAPREIETSTVRIFVAPNPLYHGG